MAWCHQAASHYLSQCWPRSLSPYGVISPQSVSALAPWDRWFYFNSLWPSDTIWKHKSGSTLAQVMACCLMAPSHYLTNLDLSSVRSNGIHLSAILQEIAQPSVTKISFVIIHLKFCSNLSGANELTPQPSHIYCIYISDLGHYCVIQWLFPCSAHVKIWISAGLMLNWHSGTNFDEV